MVINKKLSNQNGLKGYSSNTFEQNIKLRQIVNLVYLDGTRT